MADQKLTQLTEDTSPTLDDLIYLVTDPAGTPASRKVTLSNVLKVINAPSGFLINGKIVPSVTSNNLTVAIKGLDGNDPSSTNPVIVRIGDTIRTITSALSVTKNAGTNWFNAGGAELATKEIDYFVYLGYNATDGVVVGFSRLPYGTEYDDFNTTSTNDHYAAISTITNAVAGDDYVLIGRFAATLSAGAGYTWSVPTFTNKNLIQRPIYNTRWLAWTATVSGGTSISYDVNKYQITYNRIVVSMRNADGTSNATTKTLVAPMSSGTTHTNIYNSGLFTYKNNGAQSATIGHMSLAAGGATTVNFYTSWYQGAWTGSSTFSIYMPYLMYEIE